LSRSGGGYVRSVTIPIIKKFITTSITGIKCTNVVVKESAGFDYVKYSSFTDGSSQLVGIVSSEILFGHETLKFRATAPAVTSTQMYVMYMLADGVTDSGWNLGSLGEIVLQVVP